MPKRNLMYTEIDQLSIALGIKELLISKGFTKADEIIKTDLAEITSRLGIDVDIAKLIKYAAKNYNYPMISDQLTMLRIPRDALYIIECLQIGSVA
jgi:hypothetical protein